MSKTEVKGLRVRGEEAAMSMCSRCRDLARDYWEAHNGEVKG